MKFQIKWLATTLCAGTALFAQNQNVYTSSVVTGQLSLSTTTNLSQVANTAQASAFSNVQTAAGEKPKILPKLPLPPIAGKSLFSVASAPSSVHTLSLVSTPSMVGFDGMTHSDQRLANSGNQFSIQSLQTPSIAVANGKILEGVNNAVRVFSTAGAQLTPTVASNQLFGLGPAIDRTRRRMYMASSPRICESSSIRILIAGSCYNMLRTKTPLETT